MIAARFALVALASLHLACSGAATRTRSSSHPPPAPPTQPQQPAPTPAQVVAPLPAPAPVVSAVERARAASSSLAELTADEASWVRPRLLGALLTATRVLPAPTPVERRDALSLWTLIADASSPADAFDHACEAVTREEPRVACASDSVAWSGADRARVVFAWRSPASATSAVPFTQPLRALSRLGRGLCLVHAERSLRTLDLTVRAPDHESLGRALALMTVSPSLHDMILVRADLRGGGVEAVLSWSIERATADGDLGDDAWPTRCDGHSTVGAEALSGTVPVARAWVRGRSAQGAVLRVGRREWVVTAGDHAASVDVVGVRETGVTVRLGARTALLRFPTQGPGRRGPRVELRGP